MVFKKFFEYSWQNVALVSGVQLCYALLTTSVAAICFHTTLLRYHWLYSYAVPFIPMTYSFHNRKPLSPTTLTLFCPSLPPPPVWQRFMCLFLLLMFVYSFFFLFRFHMSGIIWYLSFSVWFISLSIIPSKSIHVITNGTIASFFMAI